MYKYVELYYMAICQYSVISVEEFKPYIHIYTYMRVHVHICTFDKNAYIATCICAMT